MTTIPEIMHSVTQVLTTADELNAEGDSEQVGIMLASFLRTLLVDLDKLIVEQPQYTRKNIPMPRRDLQGGARKGKPKSPVINKYDGTCKSCNIPVPAKTGFVLPIQDGNRKWTTYCANHYDAAAAKA